MIGDLYQAACAEMLVRIGGQSWDNPNPDQKSVVASKRISAAGGRWKHITEDRESDLLFGSRVYY